MINSFIIFLDYADEISERFFGFAVVI